MEKIIAYRGRSFISQDITTIRGIIASHPDRSRRFISQEVCRELNWRQSNGVLKDMVCRSFLLLLEANISLPHSGWLISHGILLASAICYGRSDQGGIQTQKSSDNSILSVGGRPW